MPARAYSFARSVLEQAQGPEALTVERPAETRQEEIRALLGPLATRGATGSAPARQAGGWRFEPSRVDCNEGREPDGDGTALIPRHDVVRLHGALPNDNDG